MDKQKILIVDDEEGVLKVLEHSLGKEGYEILRSKTGAEAIKKAKQHFPNLIIMDIMLPDIDGCEAVRELQGIPATENIPVIFLSSILDKAHDENPQVKVGEILYDAVAKPFSHEELMSQVRKHVPAVDQE
jgi:CheY-like chemotaxis protein